MNSELRLTRSAVSRTMPGRRRIQIATRSSMFAILNFPLCLCASVVFSPRLALADGDISRVQLRTDAAVTSEPVRLGDVLVLAGADAKLAEELGAQPVFAKPTEQPTTAITHDQIVKRLEELGVNLSRVLVGGALTCRITRAAPTPAIPDADPLLRTPLNDAAITENTLADAIRNYANRALASLGGSAELSFERAGQEFLRLTTPPWEFDVSAPGRDKLGLREFRVLIRRDGQVQRTVEVLANVRLVRSVVVARRPLNPGNPVRTEDLGVETRVFEQGIQLGLSDVSEAIGQQITKFVPAGQLVPADAIKRGDLVARTRPVTVVSEAGPVQVRLSGVALDSGTYGDTVRVRLGDARGAKRVLQGVVAGLGTVRLSEGAIP